MQLLKLLSLSLVFSHSAHMYDSYYMHIIPLSSYDWYKLNSHLTCFQRGFIAQLVEHRTGISKVMGFNPVGAFSGLSLQLLKLLHNCEDHFYLYYFIPSAHTYMIHIMYTSFHYASIEYPANPKYISVTSYNVPAWLQ